MNAVVGFGPEPELKNVFPGAAARGETAAEVS